VPARVAVVGPGDPGGFDATLERCAFAPDRVLPSAPAPGCNVPRRYAARGGDGGPDAAVRRVDQIVLHYDAAGTSRRCFEVLHDVRGLSCHFLVDVDGTVRQTLDLALRARHATVSNDRSVGIEIAHVGAHPRASTFAPIYRLDEGRLVVALPRSLGPPPGGPFVVARPDLVRGRVNGRDLVQPDFTEAQYRALEGLLPELRRLLPGVAARVPRTSDGRVPADALPPEELAAFSGVLGHQHVQTDKTDPGPAFDWERIARAVGAE
jgi:N-acetylmuramoyl-L-alanine amidase